MISVSTLSKPGIAVKPATTAQQSAQTPHCARHTHTPSCRRDCPHGFLPPCSPTSFSTPCLFHATFLWQVSGKNVSCVSCKVPDDALHGLCDIFAALGLRAPAIHVPGAMGSGKTRLGIHAAEKYRDVAEATAITGHINPNMRDVDASMLEHARAHRNKTSSPSTQSSSHPQTHTTLSPSCAFFTTALSTNQSSFHHTDGQTQHTSHHLSFSLIVNSSSCQLPTTMNTVRAGVKQQNVQRKTQQNNSPLRD